MYFSKKNKNYMYETLSKVIYDETGIQISDSQKYIDIYRIHYPSIFEAVDADELIILNEEIINRIGNIILKDMKDNPKEQASPKAVFDVSFNNESDKIPNKIPNKEIISLYSSSRLPGSLNRYQFSLKVEFLEFRPKTITLLKETNSLFSNPNINVLFQDTDNILFKLKDRSKLGDLEYYTYECLTDDMISTVNGSLKIQIRNYLMNDPLLESDLYSIKQIKTITHESTQYLCLEIDNHDIKEDEELGLLCDEKIVTSLFVKKVFQNYVLTDKIMLDLSKSYKCLQMNKNITLTGFI